MLKRLKKKKWTRPIKDPNEDKKQTSLIFIYESKSKETTHDQRGKCKKGCPKGNQTNT